MFAHETKSLLRGFLRAARAFPDYNIASYVKRRALEGFRENRALRGEARDAAIADAKAQLEVVRRQAVVRGLYANRLPSVMDLAKPRGGAAGKRGAA